VPTCAMSAGQGGGDGVADDRRVGHGGRRRRAADCEHDEQQTHARTIP
jgi:hypothetical protein